MSNSKSVKFGLFFISRALSTFGDEIWEIALPLFFSLAGYTSQQMGSYYSAYALGTVLGFILLPRLAARYRASGIAVLVDLIQLLVFSLIAIWLLLGLATSVLLFASFGVVLASATAIWFGSSETLATQIVERSSAQSFHRLNYLSSTMGPLIAPLLASSLFFAIGLFGIAVINALTFIPQIIAVKSLSSAEKKQVISTDNIQKTERFTLHHLLTHPHYGPLLGVTTTVKIGLLGLLPFIPFLLARSIINVFVLGAIISAFAVGSAAGAFFYRSTVTSRLGGAFLKDTTVMFFSTACLVVALKYQIVWLVILSSFCSGFFCARYSIEIRAMRQLISPSCHIPALVSLQGLFSRVMTPVAGIAYGLLFASTTIPFASIVTAILIIVSGVIFSIFAAMGYGKVNRSNMHQM